MKKISIIVPVYNLASCIKICMDSLYNQDMSLEDYEVIIVDDGSTDKTSEIIKANLKSNTILLYQENARQGAARNNALRKASGEYIFYVDGDDELVPNVLLGLYNDAKKNDLDALFFRKIFSQSGVKKTGGICGDFKRVYSGKDYLAIRGLGLGPIGVYRREFLLKNNLFFLEKVLYEDSELMPKICFFSDKIMNSEIVPYIINISENSSTRGAVSSAKLKNMQIVVTALQKFANSMKKEKGFADLAFYASMVFNTFFSLYRAAPKEMKKEIHLDKEFKKEVLSLMIFSKNRKYFFEALILFLFWRFIF